MVDTSTGACQVSLGDYQCGIAVRGHKYQTHESVG